MELEGSDKQHHGGSAYPDFLEKSGRPTGNVAIVVTDIEGSTLLWNWNGEVMFTSSEIHDNVMRNKIKQYNGYVRESPPLLI